MTINIDFNGLLLIITGLYGLFKLKKAKYNKGLDELYAVLCFIVIIIGLFIIMITNLESPQCPH